MRPACRTSRLPAFTLVEVLVVIGIIAVLIALLMPGLGRVRAQSRSVTCANQLRQIYAASAAWKIDNETQRFTATNWRSGYRKYLQTPSVYLCPEDDVLTAAQAAGDELMEGAKISDYRVKIYDGSYNYLWDVALEPGPWVQERNRTGNSWEAWIEDQGHKGGGDKDFNDIALGIRDNGNGTVTITILPGGGSGSYHWDFVDGKGNIIWKDMYKSGGAPAGSSVTVAGDVDSGPSSYALSANIDLIYGNTEKVLGLDYLLATALPSQHNWAHADWLDYAGNLRFARHMGQANVLYGDGSVRRTPVSVSRVNPAIQQNRIEFWEP